MLLCRCKYFVRCVFMWLPYCVLPEQTITDTTQNHYEGIIDSGRELALMFDILKDQTSKMNQVIAGFFTTCLTLYNVQRHFW